jgi:hypothetical protein
MKKKKFNEKHPGSFRDPGGFVFRKNGEIYRQINRLYKKEYDHLVHSGLYQKLVSQDLLLPHTEVKTDLGLSDNTYKVIKPKPVPFISYPYEWCFSQLKDATLATLAVQKISLDYDMCLKDASAYNIQFMGTRPVLVDTLSFALYEEGKPWIAYQQFCQHFLAPLALMAYTDARLNKLLRIFLDGVPLDLTSALLPHRTWLKFSLLSHLHLHAKSQKHLATKTVDLKTKRVARRALTALIDNLESTIKQLTWKPKRTIWQDYYSSNSYSPVAFNHKKQLVTEFLNKRRPKTVWDLGANLGEFSQIAVNQGALTIAFDNDPSAIENYYLRCKQAGETSVLPLFLDVTNPSPGIGWGNQERDSLSDRGPADTIMALALIHHLVISNNLTFPMLAHFFSQLCDSLIIEFIPSHDSQAKNLLAKKTTLQENYSQKKFETDFAKFFRLIKKVEIKESARSLYLMSRK